MEDWQDIPSFPNYQASSLGRIRSLDWVDAAGKTQKSIVLKQYRDKSGRMQVHLTRDGRAHTKFSHRLILEAFSGPGEPGDLCLHWDDDPSNNKPSNLRWGSRLQNAADAKRNGKIHAANKTHCLRNHPLMEPNLVPSRLKRGQRCCLACQRELNNRKGRPFSAERAEANYQKIMEGQK